MASVLVLPEKSSLSLNEVIPSGWMSASATFLLPAKGVELALFGSVAVGGFERIREAVVVGVVGVAERDDERYRVRAGGVRGRKVDDISAIDSRRASDGAAADGEPAGQVGRAVHDGRRTRSR